MPGFPVRQLAGIDAPLYSDMLLHDMGEELSDGIQEGEATGRHWRTAPLMGLRHLSAYLHDGRARTVREAVEFHGGEAQGSLSRFSRLTQDEQAALLRFVEPR